MIWKEEIKHFIKQLVANGCVARLVHINQCRRRGIEPWGRMPINNKEEDMKTKIFTVGMLMLFFVGIAMAAYAQLQTSPQNAQIKRLKTMQPSDLQLAPPIIVQLKVGESVTVFGHSFKLESLHSYTGAATVVVDESTTHSSTILIERIVHPCAAVGGSGPVVSVQYRSFTKDYVLSLEIGYFNCSQS